jgi:cytochrome c biogenesis protein CcdA
VTNPGVPILFIGDRVLLGDAEITDRFESEILLELDRLASCNDTAPAPVLPETPECPAADPALSLPLVVGAALVDSTNPCGLGVLAFLLITMTAAGGRRRILLVGGSYIAAMFFFHLLVGIGLFSLFALSGLAKVFSILGGLVALVLGIITLADVIRNRDTFFLSISPSHKGLLSDYARAATLPAAFALGILAGILGFTCTGGIYISILGLMGKEMAVMAGLPWLILYNLVYVLPLVLITLLVAYGLSAERAEMLRGRYKREVRLVIGIILAALGAIILLGWLG